MRDILETIASLICAGIAIGAFGLIMICMGF